MSKKLAIVVQSVLITVAVWLYWGLADPDLDIWLTVVALLGLLNVVLYSWFTIERGEQKGEDRE